MLASNPTSPPRPANAAVFPPQVPSLAIQRNVAPGRPLPNFAEMAETHLEDKFTSPKAVNQHAERRLVPDLIAKSTEPEFFNNAYADYLAQPTIKARWAKPPIGLVIENSKIAATVAPLARETILNPPARVNDVKKGLFITHRNDVPMTIFISKFFWDVTNYAMTQAKLPTATGQQALANAVTQEFIDFHKLQMEAPDESDQKQWVKALKKLPFVKELLKNTGNLRRPDDRSSFWKNGGSLQDPDNITIDTNSLPPERQVRKGIEDRSIYETIARADRFIKNAVAQPFLWELNKPRVTIKTMYSSADSKSDYIKKGSLFQGKDQIWRAEQDGDTIFIAQDENSPIVVHEVGHYVENHVSGFVWRDVHKLMAERHAVAGGGGLALKGPLFGSTEGRYGGEYPATGKYTSKVYTSGSTEVVSMTLEFLSRPSDAKRMIERDPQQTALVLRGLNPAEYARCDDLRPFDKYLPHLPH